jgi:hypothetical protein
MAVIGINYADGNKKDLGYKSVRISYGNNKNKLFKTGNFIKDWYDMRKFIIQKLLEKEPHFCHSSDVDHFIMDGAPYDSAYLHMENDKPVLKYVDRSDPNYIITQEETYEGVEFFVPEGTKPTFEELKEICK